MKRYDNELKQQAVKKILDGQSVTSVSRELGVAEGVLHAWWTWSESAPISRNLIS